MAIEGEGLFYFDEKGVPVPIRQDSPGVKGTSEWVEAQNIGDTPHVEGVRNAANEGELNTARNGVQSILDNN
jgi:hypothetical protein